MERVFEPFVTSKQGGLGLGLAICRSIVKAHRGRLWAVNNPLGGATFHLALPLGTARPHPCAPPGTSSRSPRSLYIRPRSLITGVPMAAPEKVDSIVIGAGQAGGPLAGALARAGARRS